MTKLLVLLGVLIAIQTASKKAPQKALDLYNKGIEKQNNQNYRASVVDFSNAIKADSTFYLPYYNRGLAKLFLKDFTGAINDLDFCIEKQPSGIAYYFRAVAKANIGANVQACQDFTKAKALGHSRDEFKLWTKCSD